MRTSFNLHKQSKIWDCSLQAFAKIDIEPEKEVLDFLSKGPNILGRRGLEIGCGLGRHTLAALNLGFEVSAVDFSNYAINSTHELIKPYKYKANILNASMNKLPFKDGEFDFTFSWCVLNHGTRDFFEKSIVESIRVLRPGGFSFGFVMSKKDSRYGHGIPLGEDCFIFTEGIEAGICHYFPSEVVLNSVLKKKAYYIEFNEIQYSDDELVIYHSEAKCSSHFCYIVQKSKIV